MGTALVAGTGVSERAPDGGRALDAKVGRSGEVPCQPTVDHRRGNSYGPAVHPARPSLGGDVTPESDGSRPVLNFGISGYSLPPDGIGPRT